MEKIGFPYNSLDKKKSIEIGKNFDMKLKKSDQNHDSPITVLTKKIKNKSILLKKVLSLIWRSFFFLFLKFQTGPLPIQKYKGKSFRNLRKILQKSKGKSQGKSKGKSFRNLKENPFKSLKETSQISKGKSFRNLKENLLEI